MPAEDLDDDYVANLLKQDAKAGTLGSIMARSYSSSARPSSQAPKPNTRFLRNILRETDSHNAALLAKEAEESRARLRVLQREQDVKQQSGDPWAKSEGSHSRKRKRADEERRDHRRSELHEDGGRYDGKHSRRCTEERGRRSDDRSSRHRRHHHSDKDSDYKSSNRHHRSRRHRSRSPARSERPQSRSPTSRHSHKEHRRRRTDDKNRSRSPPSKSSKRRDERRRHRSRSRSRSRSPASKSRSGPQARSSKHRKSSVVGSDSDPLESIVGPLPPPEPIIRSKGRGAYKNSSAMDAHFSKDYDPSADVHLDLDMEDDWGQALEAVRDRQKWQQQGADRLRSAGFTEDEIRKWEKGGEKTEDDVRWAKKGEGREWDRGKVVHDSGEITLSAEWGRLKGT